MSLRGVNAEEIESVMNSEKLIKFLTKTKENAAMKVQSITFEVDSEIKFDVSKFDGCGWTASCVLVGNGQCIKLQRESGGI